MGKSTPPSSLTEEAESNERWHWGDEGLGAATIYESVSIQNMWTRISISSTSLGQGFRFTTCLFLVSVHLFCHACMCTHFNSYWSSMSSGWIFKEQWLCSYCGYYVNLECYLMQRHKELCNLSSIFLLIENTWLFLQYKYSLSRLHCEIHDTM